MRALGLCKGKNKLHVICLKNCPQASWSGGFLYPIIKA